MHSGINNIQHGISNIRNSNMRTNNIRSNVRSNVRSNTRSITNNECLNRCPIKSNERNLQLYLDMQKAWDSHGAWSRAAIIASVLKTSDKDIAVAKFKETAKIIASLIPIEGIYPLLKEHVDTDVDVVGAMIEDNKAKFEELKSKLYANADQIANVLSSSLGMPSNATRKMMRDHITLTVQSAYLAYMGKDKESVAIYERMLSESEHMAKEIVKYIIR